MKNIACIGWGSLIWDSRTLPIQGSWFQDGPFIPVEFVRQSADGRLTLVIEPNSRSVKTLWAKMDNMELEPAIEALRNREGIPKSSIDKIGNWSIGEKPPNHIPKLSEWAKSAGVDAVIWTALGPKYDKKDGEVPSAEQAVQYLRTLAGSALDEAEKYIRHTPIQIDTEYRRRFEVELGWNPIR